MSSSRLQLEDTVVGKDESLRDDPDGTPDTGSRGISQWRPEKRHG